MYGMKFQGHGACSGRVCYIFMMLSVLLASTFYLPRAGSSFHLTAAAPSERPYNVSVAGTSMKGDRCRNTIALSQELRIEKSAPLAHHSALLHLRNLEALSL